ncbi:hypothetical protein SAMN05421678_12221 [Actinopolymorpha cephalotaxi]|uniref:Uncharacterized protein n=1 Tax=Actinopolymorpha cephalotaxi TaxID=504797 RepID=A0A1I3B488_9ACTN|nr:hypothetical protein [Actinopolymorpha cephalotaxi]NYH81234.1 hypothetical protein [Actinopolymorpha cephalotaxi]SFH57042.1 hypothetical protein SAMN05421678_12221 [Actinopolymorpha cephalotaxi]
MTNWSALSRRTAEEKMHREHLREHPAVMDMPDEASLHEIPNWKPEPRPEPGTGHVYIMSREPPWIHRLSALERRALPDELKKRTWHAVWYSNDGVPGSVECPVTHRRGVEEWAARQPAETVVEPRRGSLVNVPAKLPPAVNRAPDPGCGILRIWLDGQRPEWRAAWFDIYAGLAEFSHDDLREVITWADAQPAAEKVIQGDVLPHDEIDLADFRADPDLYLQGY